MKTSPAHTLGSYMVTAVVLMSTVVVVLFAQPATAQQIITTYSAGAPGDPFSGPTYLAIDKAGNLFVADTGNHRVQRIDKVTKNVTTVVGTGVGGYTGDGGPATQAQLDCPRGLAFDPSGNLFIADRCQNVVRKVTPGADQVITGAADETISTFAGNGAIDTCFWSGGDGGAATQATVNSPYEVRTDAAGNVFILEADCVDLVRRVDAASGTIGTETNFLTGYTGGQNAIVFDNNWNLLVSYFGTINLCSLTTGSCTGAVGGQFISPLPRAVDKTGNLYFTDNQCDGGGCDLQIFKATPGTDGLIGGPGTTINMYAGNGLPGYSGDGGDPLQASFRGPAGMVADGAGNLYIADIGNNVIRMIGAPIGPNAPALISKPSDPTNQNSATFTFLDGDPTAVSFLCTLDGVQAACASPVSYSGLADGSHTFSVVAQTSGGTSGAPTSYTWTVDTVPPPVPSIDSAPANPSGNANAAFSFSDAEAGVAFTCSLDGAALFCSSPILYPSLADGSHTFAVSSKDAAGNQSAANTYVWTIRTTTPPAPSIDSAPPVLTNQAAPAFAFSDAQTGVNFVCELDTSGFAPCTSPVTYIGLADGAHTFSVLASDPVSGRSSSATSYTWTQDTTPPKVGISGGGGTVIIPASTSFSFSGSSDIATYLCSVDGSAYTPCSPPFSTSNVTSPGTHTFSVEAIDAAGNVSAPDTSSWTNTFCHCPVAGGYTDPLINPNNFSTTSPGGAFSFSAVSSFGGASVSVVRSDGTVAYRFTVPQGYAAHWEFSPDGMHFFYFTAAPLSGGLSATAEDIVVVDLSNSSATTMLNLSRIVFNSTVQWSPSGAYLLVASNAQYLTSQTEIRLYRVAGVSTAVLVHSAQISTGGSTAGADIASWGFNQDQSGEPERAFLYAWVTGQNTFAWNVVDLAAGKQTISQSGTNISGYWQFNPCGNIVAFVNQTSLNGEEVDMYSVESGAHLGGTSFPLQSVTLNSTGEQETATIATQTQAIVVAQDPSCTANTPTGKSILVAPQAAHNNTSPITVTYSNVTQGGGTGVTTSSTGAAAPGGFEIGTPPVYYDISTSASYSGPISICINYSGISFAGSPKLYHYENGAWVDRTTSVDTTTHIVCASVTSLSPFAIFSTPAHAPAITSGATAIFLAGSPGSFTVTSSGDPTAAVMSNGLLPDGVTFVDNGDGTATLAGTPTSSGTYPLTLTAFNGIGPDGTQVFTLTVNASPAFTSANTATFTAGTAGSFNVTATGFPAPSLAESGGLPSGMTFDPTSGLLSGTPALGTGGIYTITFTASNGVAGATQTFTLTVRQAPAITSGNSATFTLGMAGSFTVTTTGFPTASLGETGVLPAGITFADNGNGTATLSGTTSASGSFPLTLTATNGVGNGVTQSFTLLVSGGANATVTPSTINFGNVPLYQVAAAKVILQNTGSKVLTINNVSITPGTGVDRDDFLFFSFCGTSLAPGKTCPIYVFYDADDLGTVNATLNIADNGPGGLQTVGLLGTAVKKR